MLCTITYSILSGNVNNFQFLLGQEIQLTELAASVLQNSVWISQLLKRKKVTLLVQIMGGYPEWLQNMTETITLQITTALQ